MAASNGLFSAEGLAVTTNIASGSPDAIARVAAGTSDFALVDINALVRFRDKDKQGLPPIKAVFVLFNKAPYSIIARISRGIRALTDIEIGTLVKRSLEKQGLEFHLERLTRTRRADAEPEIRGVISGLLDRETVTTPLSSYERESVITDQQGNVNDLLFSEIKTNSNIPDATFRWAPPAGVRPTGFSHHGHRHGPGSSPHSHGGAARG